MEKYCSSCKETKVQEDFAKNALKKDGLQSVCRACKKRMDAESFQKNKQAQYLRNKKNIAIYRNELNVHKSNQGCCLCNEDDPCCLDFHHIDPNTKRKAVGLLVAGGLGKQLWDEIEKCVLLCACCHRKIHACREASLAQLAEHLSLKEDVLGSSPR
jgi:hypothetical protein